MGQSAGGRELYITIEAGETQSQQLFDFNSTDNRIITNQMISNDTFIVHDGQNLLYQSKSNDLTPLYSVKINQDALRLQSSPSNKKMLWRVLPPGQVYPLDAGNLIKIGKARLKLKEIVEEDKQLTQKDFKSRSIYLQDMAEVRSTSNKSCISNDNQCRICFDNSHNRENPLVCLCKCSGSVKYIHYNCLKDWINNKVEKREQNNTLFFSYEETKCQLCQELYHPQFTFQGRKYPLLNLQNAPNPPYAVFQQVQSEIANRRYSIFLIGLGQQQITIGRNSSSTVVMKEISVSRIHCSIIYKNKKLLIKDKGSKFGTLIKVAEKLQFSPSIGLNLQYESKLIKIYQKNKLGCCCAQNDGFRLEVNQDFIEEHQYSESAF